jgi:PncC family amidohydrolase
MSVEPAVLADASALADARALAERAVASCLARGWRLSTAESCTGGLVGHILTDLPGVSRVYVGGIVAYGDETKRALLGVMPETLERHGAVSAQACVAMAEGARRALRAHTAIAVTGIAGPDGGTAAKPVGLTYVAVADPEGHDVRRHVWTHDRAVNKAESARAALALLVERLEEATPPPHEP